MVQVVTGDSQEEVIIFRDRQTDRQTLHHNIYIIIVMVISSRERVADEILRVFKEQCDPWGVTVERVEVSLFFCFLIAVSC